METPYQAPLTPEQTEPTIDEDYVREKLAEAQASMDRGEVAEWNIEELKADLRARLVTKQAEE